MYELTDTFNNNRLISRHRTLVAALKADRKFQRAVKRANGNSSYCPTTITQDGERIPSEVMADAEMELYRQGGYN